MSEELTTEIIYKYDNHQNIPWNIVEYKPLNQYHGKQVNISYSTRYVTKKGNYMDEHLKTVKHTQSPDKYPIKCTFDQTQNKKQSHKHKINPRLKKHTYIDDIQLQGKKTKIGVGSYCLEKTDKQIQEEVKNMAKYIKSGKAERTSFYQDIQVLSNTIPGSGAYNPHLEVLHIKTQRMTPQNWRKKHVEQSSQFIKKAKKKPGPSSYRPASAGTFDRMKLDTERDRKKRSKSLNKGFGTDAKFEYCRVSKKKIIEERPDPTKYDLRITWKGKKDETKKHGWNSFLSTRSNSMSVYNSK